MSLRGSSVATPMCHQCSNKARTVQGWWLIQGPCVVAQGTLGVGVTGDKWHWGWVTLGILGTGVIWDMTLAMVA